MTVMTRRPILHAAHSTSTDQGLKGACTANDVDLFFAEGDSQDAAERREHAKEICALCPIREQCLTEAMERFEQHGVWGGLTERERSNLRRRQARGAARAAAVDPRDAEEFLNGQRASLSSHEEDLAAILFAVGQGLTYREIDKARGKPQDATATFVSRERKRYAQEGKPFPSELQRTAVKLSGEQAREIREQYAAGDVTMLKLAGRWDVSRNTISHVVSGATHKGAGGPIAQQRSETSVKASREYMCGHASGSMAARNEQHLSLSEREINRDEMESVA
jgi:hypothetical protein